MKRNTVIISLIGAMLELQALFVLGESGSCISSIENVSGLIFILGLSISSINGFKLLSETA